MLLPKDPNDGRHHRHHHVGNVFRIIMPAQRALVAAIAENRTPDPTLHSACRAPKA